MTHEHDKRKRNKNKRKETGLFQINLQRIVRIFPCHFFNPGRHCCREKHALPLEWRVPKITSKTLFKYNRKHMISFIKDQIYNPPSLRLLTFSRSLVRPGVRTTKSTPRERAFCSVTEETPP